MTQRRLRIKRCERCGNEYETRSDCAKYCPDCQPVVQQERMSRFYARRGGEFDRVPGSLSDPLDRLVAACERLLNAAEMHRA